MIEGFKDSNMNRVGSNDCDKPYRKLSDYFHDSVKGSKILALASVRRSSLSPENRFLKVKSAADAGRTLLMDRKGWLDHLNAQNLVKSTFRVTVIQASNSFATYLQDRLQADYERDELVNKGKLSASKADRQQEQWEKEEWNRRIKELPYKILVGLGKFHAITLVMRFYESLAERWFDEFTLDRLTLDPFDASIRVAKQSHTKSEVATQMYAVCFWSNVIAFMADYSVHQVILTFTYYRYYESRRKKRTATSEKSQEDLVAPLMLSYLVKSTSLIFSRALGLFAAAIGGAWGSAITPGWGTMIGSSFGDGIMSSIFDEIQPSIMKVQK